MRYNGRVLKIPNLEAARTELLSIGVDDPGVAIMAPKAVHRVIKLEGVPVRAANILKQEMLAVGGEAGVARGVSEFSVETSDVLLMGTESQLKRVAEKLRRQPFGLKAVAAEIAELVQNLGRKKMGVLSCREYSLPVGERTLIMGILNVTPDSFSDGGRYVDPEKAVERAREMVAQGADIIDVGAESTRPGHTPVGAEEELRRLTPVVRRLVRELDVPISVDTMKARVAKAMLEEGVHIINDVWGLQRDPDMARVAAEYNTPVVVMHNKEKAVYKSLMGEILSFFRKSFEIAVRAGLREENLVIDPGFGFGKTAEQNLVVLGRLGELKVLGRPILLGTSRKSTIGKVLDLPVEERVEGTAATVAVGIVNGANIVRVHDVKEMTRVARMTDAILRWEQATEG